MPLFYHKYVNYVLAHSVNYVITLYRLAPPADCRKTSIVIKNGVWGVAPRRVAGTPVPVFTPFPGERGQGDRDNKSEVDFKNRLFLQSGEVACPSRNIIHLSQNIR